MENHSTTFDGVRTTDARGELQLLRTAVFSLVEEVKNLIVRIGVEEKRRALFESAVIQPVFGDRSEQGKNKHDNVGQHPSDGAKHVQYASSGDEVICEIRLNFVSFALL